jgi:hypothetical protein
MRPEDRLIYLLCRQEFTEKHIRQAAEICRLAIDWDTFATLAETQGAGPLIQHNLEKLEKSACHLPDTARAPLKRAYISNVFMKARAEARLRRVLELLKTNGQKALLVKGAALNAQIYDQPWYTRSWDIDLVLPFRENQVDRLQLNELIRSLEALNAERETFQTHIEYDFYAHHDLTMNEVLSVDSDRLWRDARAFSYLDYDILVLSPEDTLITTAIAACRKRYFRLKLLLDLAECTQRLDDLDWDQVAAKSRAYRCGPICYTALQVAESTLGCRVPARLWDQLGVGRLQRWMIDRLIDGLLKKRSLAELSAESSASVFGRAFSLPLLLTYISYHLDQLPKKVIEIWRGRARHQGQADPI